MAAAKREGHEGEGTGVLSLEEAQEVERVQLKTQEQVAGSIERIRVLLDDCQRLQTEIGRLIELRRWPAPPGISWPVAMAAALAGGTAGGAAVGIAAAIGARIF